MKNLKYINIIENIYKELFTSELSENMGLYAGTSGIALFIAYYDLIIHRKIELNPRVMDILKHNIQLINSGNLKHTICNGISGFGWLCVHLKKIGILSKKDIEFLDDLDSFLYRKMMDDIKRGYYDYLHGALGVGAYFISRFDKKEVPGYLEELLTELEDLSIHCENGAVKWMSVLDHRTGEKGYNISLSHGISSIAAFLIKLYQLDFETDRVGKLLSQTVIYILDQITYNESCTSYFPSLSKENSSKNDKSRLGWCYGDLGIAHILWQASVVLKNNEWVNTALQILRNNTQRHDLQKNAIRDAGLCHGSAGVAHIFFNLFLNTQIQEFREAADYWFNITIQMAKYDDGLAGYKTWRTDKVGGPVSSDDFLTGIAGIGLALLAAVSDIEPTWDECLMLR